MSAREPRHRQGETIDTTDQLSSVVLLGLALAGAAAAIAAHMILG